MAISDELQALKEKRDSRTIGGFFIGCVLGALLGNDLLIILAAGIIIAVALYLGGEDDIKKFNRDHTIGGGRCR